MHALELCQEPAISQRLSMPSWLRSRTRPRIRGEGKKQLRIADLFCGAGGMTLGACEVASAFGFNPFIAIAVDIDPIAMAVYRTNFQVPTSRAKSEDISELVNGTLGRSLRKSESELLERVGAVDVLVAGPPCQGHSDLNNHTRRDDDRNWLYLKAVRFAELFKPEVVIIENVRAVTLDRNEVVRTSGEMFDKLGYSVQPLIVNASELGLPQLRKRHVLLATKKSVHAFKPPHLDEQPALSLAIEDLIDESIGASDDDIFRTPSRMTKANIERVNYLFRKNKFDLPNELRPPCHRDKNHSYLSMYGRLNWDKPAQTITSGFGSPGQGRYIHPHRKRVITPHEAARIQGFPDYFSFGDVQSRVKLQELIANAVPPVLAAALLEHVIINGGLT